MNKYAPHAFVYIVVGCDCIYIACIYFTSRAYNITERDTFQYWVGISESVAELDGIQRVEVVYKFIYTCFYWLGYTQMNN